MMIQNFKTFATDSCKPALTTLIMLLLASCSTTASQLETTASNETEIKSSWFQDPGKHQSPINIHTLKSHKMKQSQQYEVHFKDEIEAVENKGHTIQVNFSHGSEVVFEGVHYDFRQFHFHTPAEHHIDDIAYPMEMHIVCSTDDQEPSYVVLGLLFKMGQENKFLSEFLQTVPKQANSSKPLEFNQVRFTDFLSLEDKGKLAHHFHYKGSLTTPPYTERVNWMIYQHIFEASPEQIELIQQLEGYNARPIQKHNPPVDRD